MSAQDVLNVMEEEIQALHALLALVRQQQHALVHGEIEAFTRTVPDQTRLMGHLKVLERRRGAAAAACAPEGSEEIRSARSTLRALVEQVHRVNHQNRTLIRRSLTLIRQQLQLFFGAAPEPATYTGTGDYAAPAPRQLLNTTI
jgi:flagellar biosynthesis/type III secretory pathway chaperone